MYKIMEVTGKTRRNVLASSTPSERVFGICHWILSMTMAPVAPLPMNCFAMIRNWWDARRHLFGFIFVLPFRLPLFLDCEIWFHRVRLVVIWPFAFTKHLKSKWFVVNVQYGRISPLNHECLASVSLRPALAPLNFTKHFPKLKCGYWFMWMIESTLISRFCRLNWQSSFKPSINV